MIPFPADWAQTSGPHVASAYPPGLGARFRYFERVRPQPSLSVVVDRCLAGDPGFRVTEISESLRVVTAEGEYGAWVALHGRREGSPARHFVGAVLTGEFGAVLDAVALVPAHFGAIEKLSLSLLHQTTFALGRRPRQFYYVPPPGWQAIPSGAATTWYPPDFPRNLSTIQVSPAAPIEGDEQHAVTAAERALAAGLEEHVTASRGIVAANGRSGVQFQVQGRRRERQLCRDLAVFVVASHLYRMRLETAAAHRLLELRALLDGVVASFEPLPGPAESRLGRVFAQVDDLGAHWVS